MSATTESHPPSTTSAATPAPKAWDPASHPPPPSTQAPSGMDHHHQHHRYNQQSPHGQPPAMHTATYDPAASAPPQYHSGPPPPPGPYSAAQQQQPSHHAHHAPPPPHYAYHHPGGPAPAPHSTHAPPPPPPPHMYEGHSAHGHYPPHHHSSYPPPPPPPHYRRSSWEGGSASPSMQHVTPERAGTFRGGACTCKKSKCLKLYCQCFASSTTCGSRCKCQSCQNTANHGEAIQKARQVILDRNPSAFEDKFPQMHHHHHHAPSTAMMRAQFTPGGFRESPPQPAYHRSSSAPLPSHPPPSGMYQTSGSPTGMRQKLSQQQEAPSSSSPHAHGPRTPTPERTPDKPGPLAATGSNKAHKTDDGSTGTAATEKTGSSVESSSHDPTPSNQTPRRVSNVPQERSEKGCNSVDTSKRIPGPSVEQLMTPHCRRVSDSQWDPRAEEASSTSKGPSVSRTAHFVSEEQLPEVQPPVPMKEDSPIRKQVEENKTEAKAVSSSDPLAMMAAIAMTELFGRVKEEENSEADVVKVAAKEQCVETLITPRTPEKQVIDKQPKRKSLTGDETRLPPKKRRSPSPPTMERTDSKIQRDELGMDDSDNTAKTVENLAAAISLESRDPSPVSQLAANHGSPTSHHQAFSGHPYHHAPSHMTHGHYYSHGKDMASPKHATSYSHVPRTSPPPPYHHQYPYPHHAYSHSAYGGVPPPPTPPPLTRQPMDHAPSTPRSASRKHDAATKSTPRSGTPKEDFSAQSPGLPKSLTFRKICSKCGKTRSEHGELGFGNKCVFQECGKCKAGIHVHRKAGQPMGFFCELAVEEGAAVGAIETYQRKIQDLAERADLQKELQQQQRQ